ncbi:V-type proton ATPase subunit d 1-like [Heteronotia binoei]|uniref:V-type proton ATPase subunit d 1-like n=1 Tax=Heteronotia binoei TaxID=13085 RepID=UPI0029307CC2|nr:V-type proton ATPase subunit d 1-like [Heteronotia binoei]
MLSSFPELYFNVVSGYLEGLVRGFKAGVLSQSDYVNLVQCESLEDLKLHLQSTDYGNFLPNEASPLTVSVVDDKLKEKMVVDFRHMRNHAYEPLASFLDFITYSYMIDNVILLITGTLHQRSIAQLVPKCHPLGSFEQMEAVNIAQTPAELYNAILVDTPLAAFFQDCISEQDLDEMNIEIIRNALYKAYLESFYKFCKILGGTTADAMCPILEFEADRRAFILTINSFGTELSKEDWAKLFPHCGKLYPEGLAQLARADDYEQVKAVADYYPEYKLLFEGAGSNPGDKTTTTTQLDNDNSSQSMTQEPDPAAVIFCSVETRLSIPTILKQSSILNCRNRSIAGVESLDEYEKRAEELAQNCWEAEMAMIKKWHYECVDLLRCHPCCGISPDFEEEDLSEDDPSMENQQCGGEEDENEIEEEKVKEKVHF